MRLVSFGPRGSELPGALVHDSVLPLGRVLADIGLERTGSLRSALPFLGLLSDGIDAALKRGDELIPLAQTRLGPPIVDPPNLFACGANYFAHMIEHGADPQKMPTVPVIFLKPGSSLSGPTDPIVRPIECAQFDYEAELAIVIGKGGRRISADHAAEHIAGHMISNDVSARDLGEGDIITTGTPSGAGVGMSPPKWLTSGDAVRIEMTGLGSMNTPVVDEQAAR